jgi:hypothetical protein
VDATTETLAVFLLVFLFFGLPALLAWDALRSFPKLIFLNLFFVLTVVFISAAFAYRPTTTFQFASMLLLLYFVILAVLNLISVPKYRHKYKSKALIPLGLSILSVPAMWVSNLGGHAIRSYVFKTRLPQYENAVQLLTEQINDEPISLSGTEIPEQYRHLAYTIFALKYGPDAFTVEFAYGQGFPVKHSAYVYVSDPDLPDKELDFRRRWPRRYRVSDHWFRVGD